jgi:hypothetical protein
MSLRIIFAIVAIAIGLVGLALDFHAIATVMTVTPQNPVARSFPNFLLYYFTFLTNLSNTALVLTYVAELTGWARLGWFRRPVTRGGMAGIMMLVMFFYHFMLAPHLPPVPVEITYSNILLHYCTPILFLVWWLAFTSHGTLRFRDVPIMLLPGLLYTLYVELRGPLVGEYPYTILDPTFAPPGHAAVGYGTVVISVGILVILVAIFDTALVLVDRLLGRRQRTEVISGVAS